jgi:DNA polymerase-3 subunit alpha
MAGRGCDASVAPPSPTEVHLRQFVNLHHHATNSYGDGIRPVEEHVKAVAELGYPGMALTDHGNVTGHVKLEKHCLAAGIKPLFGCELYTETHDERGQLKNHLTVIAETPEGFQNLNRLVSASWQNFRYKPTVTSEMLVRYNEGLIVMSGCMGGLLSTAMYGGKGTPEKKRADRKAAEKVAGWFADLFGDRYYLEVMPHPQLAKQRAFNEELARLGQRLDVPLVATLDCHYPDPSFKDMYPVIHAIDRGGRNNTVEAQSQSWEYDIMLAPRPVKEIYRDLQRTGLNRSQASEAMDSTIEIMKRCNVTIPKFQELKFPGEKPSDELIWEWCRRGWKYRGLSSLSAKEQRRYVEKLKYELGLIIPKGFSDYFLVVSDLVRYAKNNGIAVGPARGSAAASLVCYLMRITEVDPMHFPTLLFERFVDANRHDLPDIDLDFDDERRWEVRQYLVDTYGEAHVGNIATVTNYKGKNSLDDIARVYRIPQIDVDTVKEMIIERSSGDLRGNTTIEDSEAMFPKVAAIFKKHPKLRLAKRLEGGLKGFSVHAAGLVVADEPLTNGVAVYSRKDSKTKTMRNVLSIDKYDAEYINALKIDALGLLTMNVIARCLAMVGMTLEELYEIPLDDEEVFDAFKRNEVVGLFQFDGRAMRSVCREVKPDNFAEICDINALARPGPLHSGAAAEYIQVKHGRKPADHLHPIVDEITKWTNYQIVYQEQILQVVQRLGNFTWEQAAQIRKLISKKQGEQAFNRMQQLFMDGCKQNGVKDVNAGKIWKQLVTAGAYAFNSAHCVSYGMLAYWTMWLKVNYPLEFYCAALQKYDPKTKGFDILKEAVKKGIKILPPDPDRSQATWSVSGKALLAGFEQIPGIGAKTAVPMVEWRDSGDRIALANSGAAIPVGFTKWEDFTAVSGIGPVTMEKVAAFVEQDDPFEIDLLANRLGKARGWLNRHADSNFMRRPTSRAEDVPYEPKLGQHVLLVAVRDRNLKDLYELHRSRTGEELDPSTVREPQFVNWAVILGEDETGPITITVHRYRGLYDKYKDQIWELNPKKHLLLVRGMKRREYRRAIYAEELWVLDPDKLKG